MTDLTVCCWRFAGREVLLLDNGCGRASCRAPGALMLRCVPATRHNVRASGQEPTASCCAVQIAHVRTYAASCAGTDSHRYATGTSRCCKLAVQAAALVPFDPSGLRSVETQSRPMFSGSDSAMCHLMCHANCNAISVDLCLHCMYACLQELCI